MGAQDAEFQSIYDLFRPKVHRYLARLVGEDEAEDLAQEVFVKISRKLTTFRGEARLSTWIYRIATNAALDRLRSPAHRRAAPIIPPDDPAGQREESVLRWGEPAPSVEQQAVRRQMRACIRNVVETLPENYRIVIVLSDLEGLEDREIAAVLGVTPGAVKIRLHRARASLKKALESRCRFYQDERNELACDLKTAFDISQQQ